MAGKIKIIIDQNGAVDMDISNMKDCGKKTKDIAAALDIDSTGMKLKDETVETVSVNKQNVYRK
jgi:hypothetical protein